MTVEAFFCATERCCCFDDLEVDLEEGTEADLVGHAPGAAADRVL